MARWEKTKIQPTGRMTRAAAIREVSRMRNRAVARLLALINRDMPDLMTPDLVRALKTSYSMFSEDVETNIIERGEWATAKESSSVAKNSPSKKAGCTRFVNQKRTAAELKCCSDGHEHQYTRQYLERVKKGKDDPRFIRHGNVIYGLTTTTTTTT